MPPAHLHDTSLHTTQEMFYIWNMTVVTLVVSNDSLSNKNGEEWKILALFLNIVFSLSYLFTNVALFMVYMLPLVIAWVRNANTPSYLASISEATAQWDI